MEKNSLNFIRFLGKWQEVSDFCRKTLKGNLCLIERDEKALMEKRDGCGFCQIMLQNPVAKERCLNSYEELFSPDVKDKGFFTFTCHLGLTGWSFPILVDKRQIATLIAAPILIGSKEPLLKKACELGIEKEKADENLKQIKEVSKDELSSLSSFVKLAISPLADEIANQYEAFQGIEEMKKKEEFLRVDKLTGLHNRLYFVKRLEEEISRAKRRKKPLSVIIFDLDQLRQVIDDHSSTIGDVITKETASLLLGFKRKEDVLCRGEANEFLLILTHTDQEQASSLAKRIQERVSGHIFCQKEGLSISLTISCGITQLAEESENGSNLIERAERTLFSAKSKGGRRILFHSEMQKEIPKRCVITGIGLVTPIGIGKDAFWQALVAGKSGVSRITQFDASNMPVKIAGEIKDFDPLNWMSKKQVNRSDRPTQMAIVAAQLAISDSGLLLEREDKKGINVIIGSGVGGLAFAEKQIATFLEQGPEKISPYLSIITFAGALSSMVSLELGVKGASITVSSGCTAGTDAVGYGFEAIKKGEAKIVLAGGAEAPIRPVILHSFYAMNALSLRNDEPERASRPFDAKRDGF
ncbi:MAG: beta-ketoacyl synthase N-terminal-like domain-containing protein, partial [Candidatus Desantisbacteria bacterium]